MAVIYLSVYYAKLGYRLKEYKVVEVHQGWGHRMKENTPLQVVLQVHKKTVVMGDLNWEVVHFSSCVNQYDVLSVCLLHRQPHPSFPFHPVVNDHMPGKAAEISTHKLQ